MREIDLILEYLEKERARHASEAQGLAVSSSDAKDYCSIVAEAKAAELLRQLILDVQLLDKDSGEFVKQFLQ